MTRRVATVGLLSLAAGCAGPPVVLPRGHLPPETRNLDVGASESLKLSTKPGPTPPPPATPGFDLPPSLPGAEAVTPVPRVPPNATPAVRAKAVADAYPVLNPITSPAPSAEAFTLAQFQQIAAEASPVVRQARAESEAAFGQVIQAGLYPNPTVGYQVDQWQPGLRIPPGEPGRNLGQHGGFVNQLIKTAGKLSLAQQVAGYDYVNALVAVRKAHVDVTAAVRTHFFAVLLAQRGVEINRGLAALADEVYRLQLKQVAAGEAAGYEPLPLYAQAVQARNAVTQSEAAARAAWARLAATVGQPDLPYAPVAGAAGVVSPVWDLDELRRRVCEQHTDLLTRRNAVAKAQTNLTLQRKLPVPDIETNTYHQYDTLSRAYQFGVQVGVPLPLSDRNQGNVRSAVAQIAAAQHGLTAEEQSLRGRLTDAFERYEANAKVVTDLRDKVLPSLQASYRSMVRRWDVDEPGKVTFNDLVVAQQNVAQALQSYLSALTGQWQAAVDVATIAQLDDLYGGSVTTPSPNPKP
jgi:cobalt-zinc-cadmium efflux system outer membrane protein